MAHLPDLDSKVSLDDIDLSKHQAAVASTEKAGEKGGNDSYTHGSNNHEIRFRIDNTGSSFNLVPDTRTFADYGSFSGSPSTVLAKQISEVCKCTERGGFWTGAAGMIGFTMTAQGTSLYLRLAATDPYWSARDNRTMVAIYTQDKDIDQGPYNDIYHNGGSAESPFAGKTLKISSNIGQAAECTATYVIKVE